MPVRKLREFLDSNGVKYVTISHSEAFTAQEIAASAHVSGRAYAKTVMLKLDGLMAMAVLPAADGVNLDMIQLVAGAGKAELATEEDFRELFPECELGAMPPFGNLYGMDVLVEQELTSNREITFNAGSHRELVKLAYKDFERLVEPMVAKFA